MLWLNADRWAEQRFAVEGTESTDKPLGGRAGAFVGDTSNKQLKQAVIPFAELTTRRPPIGPR